MIIVLGMYFKAANFVVLMQIDCAREGKRVVCYVYIHIVLCIPVCVPYVTCSEKRDLSTKYIHFPTIEI